MPSSSLSLAPSHIPPSMWPWVPPWLDWAVCRTATRVGRHQPCAAEVADPRRGTHLSHCAVPLFLFRARTMLVAVDPRRPLAVAQGDSGACVGLPIAMCSSALNCPLLCHDRARPSDDADKRRKELPNHLVGAEK